MSEETALLLVVGLLATQAVVGVGFVLYRKRGDPVSEAERRRTEDAIHGRRRGLT
jgi:hypothetical protein